MQESAERHSTAPLEGRRLAFAPAELEILSKACLMYRRRLPSYLRCAQPELELIEGILKKVS